MLSGQLETLEKNVRRVSMKLKQMSTLQFGDKWNTVTQTPQKNTIVTSLLRTFWYWGEGIKMSVADFNSTLEEAFTLVYECVDKYPRFKEDAQNAIAGLVVLLTGNISDVKMAIVRQKGAYLHDPKKETDRNALDEVVAYVDDELVAVNLAIIEAGMQHRISKKQRVRRNAYNPVVVPVSSPPPSPKPEEPQDERNNIPPEDLDISIDLDQQDMF